MNQLISPNNLAPNVRLLTRVADLERQVAALTRQTAAVPFGTAVPAGGAEGALYVQQTGTGKLWALVNGVWRSVSLV